MKALAHVDPGKGHVYRIPCETLRAARAMVRGPYCRDARIAIVAGALAECYERGTGTLADRLVSCLDLLARAAAYRLHGLGLAIGLTVSLALYARALVMSWAWIGADRG